MINTIGYRFIIKEFSKEKADPQFPEDQPLL